MEEAPEIFFVAAEASADRHVSLVAAELRRRRPYRLTGVGGPLMRQAGVQTDYDSTNWATMGIVQAVRRLPEGLVTRARLLRLLRRRHPALLVLVDFGGFNVNLARCVRRFPWHQPIMYYFPPKSWDRTERDRSWLAEIADVVATPFRWSAELLQRDGVQAYWVGHPVVDWLGPAADQAGLRQELGLPPARYYVGFLPGSRRHERRLIGPAMLQAMRELAEQRDCHFLWSPGPPGLQEDIRLPAELQQRVTVVKSSGVIMQAADLIVTAFGTATLEATVTETPMIGTYRGTLAERWLFRLMRPPTPYFALPNIILGYKAVPEIIEQRGLAHKLAQAVRELLAAPEKRETMRVALRRAKAELGPPGAVKRTADLIEQTLARFGGLDGCGHYGG